jgi:hypothetical protein
MVRMANRLRKGLCTACGYDLRSSPDRCPECGLPRPDPASCYRHEDRWFAVVRTPPSVPLTRSKVRILKVLAACDSWWFYLVTLIGCGVAAFFFKNTLTRLAIACFALPDLYSLIRRLRKGPTEFQRLLAEAAKEKPIG